MSQENVELVRSGFELMGQGDLDLFEDWTTPDLVIVQPPEVPDAKSYEGRAALAEAWQDWPDQWEDFRLDLVELIDVSDDVVVSETRHRGRGGESGIEMDFRVFYVHHLRDGKLARMEMFFRSEQALEAATALSAKPMSRENVELVRDFEKSWASGDLDAALECVHEELEFDWSDSIGPIAGTYTGHDGFTRFWTEMLDAWERFSPEMVEVLEVGPENLITLDIVRARGKGSGIDMESRGAMLWTVRKGKIVRAKMFQTKEEAVRAVALSE